MEILPHKSKYPLKVSRWKWEITSDGERVSDLKDSLSRVIHDQKLVIGYEKLPEQISVIDGGAIIIHYIQAKTDRKELAFIDPFAISHAFLYDVLP